MNQPVRLPDLPAYPATNPPPSVEREGAFSKPGTTKLSKGTTGPKGWKPANGVRYRATNEKAPGRPRKRKLDPRSVKFF